jgi:hypothetical protein
MINHKGELTKASIDCRWPHQIALPAYRCMGHNYLTIHFFCEAERLSLCTPTHSFRRNDIHHIVFCFAKPEHAEQFQVRFGGELMDSATRPRWPGKHVSRGDLVAEHRLRNGRCINCDD